MPKPLATHLNLDAVGEQSASIFGSIPLDDVASGCVADAGDLAKARTSTATDGQDVDGWRYFEDRLFSELAALSASQTRVERRLSELTTISPDASLSVDRRGSMASQNYRGSTGPFPQAGGDPVRERFLPRRASVMVSRHTSLSYSPRRNAQLVGNPRGESMEMEQGDLIECVSQTLPANWPKTLKMRTFVAIRETMPTTTVSRRHRPSFSEKGSLFAPWYVMVPNTRFHSFYMILNLVMLVYDLTAIPFMLAWQVQLEGFWSAALWFSAFFWTIDIGFSFFTAYHKFGGDLEMNLRAIARRYTRTWLVPDVLVVTCTWVAAILEGYAHQPGVRGLNMLRFARLGRTLRVLAVVRMLRVVQLVEEIIQRHVSEAYRVGARIITLFLYIMWVAHVVACIWFAIGNAGESDTGSSWMRTPTQLNGEIVDFHAVPMMFQYATAFHWSAAQIALGGFDVYPTNSLERAANILFMMVGFLFGSMLVSSLSAAMVDYQLMQKDKNQRLRALRQYLAENKVDARMCVRVQRQAEERLSVKDRLAEQDVQALASLSNTLRTELRFAIQQRYLATHPLFSLAIRMDAPTIALLSKDALGFLYMRASDELFLPGMPVETAYFLASGHLKYTQYPISSPVEEDETHEVCDGAWICEAALWCEWTTVGQAEATCSTELLSLPADQLGSVLHSHGHIGQIVTEYTRQYHKRIINARPPHAAWPTDLEVPFTDYCDLVSSMKEEVQSLIGEDACALLRKAGKANAAACKKLEQEVSTGKSVVVATGDGILRIAPVLAVKVMQEDGRFLAEIGKVNAERSVKVKASCQLPGGKRERNETIDDSLQRIIKKGKMLIGQVELQRTEVQNVTKLSPEFGVMTRYLRTVCEMRLMSEESWLTVATPCKVDPGIITSPELMVALADGTAARFWRAAMDCEVVAYTQGEQTAVYAWLDKTEFDFFSSPSGSVLLKAWVNAVSLDPATSADGLSEAVAETLNYDMVPDDHGQDDDFSAQVV